MKQNWQQAGQKVKPGLKIAGKLVLMTALRYGLSSLLPASRSE